MRSTISLLDIRLGARMLARHRGLTLIGGFAVAVAIAVGAIFFQVISEVLRPSLPLPAGERVVALQYATDQPGSPERRLLAELGGWRREIRSVVEIGAFRDVQRNLVSPLGHREPVHVAEITSAGFRVARTPPALGRYLVPTDDSPSAAAVVVIGHEAWRRYFGGDPAVVGRTVMLGGAAHVVVGVMPRGFRFPVSHQFWTPLRADASGPLTGPEVRVFGRLAAGAEMSRAQAELTALGRRISADHATTHARLRLRVLPFPRDQLDGLDHPFAARGLWLLQLLVSGLLVVVAVNMSILVYARTVTRLGEIAVRSALGATRRRILGQLFVESLALSLAGAACGLLLARAVLGWISEKVSITDEIPFWMDLSLSPVTALYGVALAVAAAGIMGVLPGLKATGRAAYGNLRQLGGGTRGKLGPVWTSLVVGQVAIAVAILPLAVFAAWQLARMEMAEVGFPADEFVTAVVSFDESAVENDEAALHARFEARRVELQRRLTAEPGVAAVVFSTAIPGVTGGSSEIEIMDGAALPDAGTLSASAVAVDPGMFAAYDARILSGRALAYADTSNPARPVVVNAAFVRKYLGGGAVGRRFRYELEAGEESPSYEVVGVVEDFPAVSLELLSAADGVPSIYHPMAFGARQSLVVSVRARGSAPPELLARMREVAAGIDPALQVRGRPLAELYGSLRSGSRLLAWGLTIVTASVLLLSAAGIFALMSFTVSQRTREIGIRAALGAYPRRILASIFGRAARQLGAGLVIGSALSGAGFLAIGMSAARAAGLLVGVTLLMLAVGLVAAWGPARRGLRIEPTEALRADG